MAARKRLRAQADWSGLPSPALCLISRKIANNADYVRFRAVCTTWRSATPARPRHLPCQSPWLALPSPEASSDARRFFTLPDGKTHSLPLPRSRGSHCCGSSFGWLVFLDTSLNFLFHYKHRGQEDVPSFFTGILRWSRSNDLLGMTPYMSYRSFAGESKNQTVDLDMPISFFLLNPLTGERVDLPPLNTREVLESLSSEPGGGYVVRGRPGPDFSCDLEYIRRHFVHRFLLSSDPTSADCVVMASFCHGASIAYCRPGGGAGDSSWTTLTGAVTPVTGVRDIVFYKGRFYAVDGRLMLFFCDLGVLPARMEEFPCSIEGCLVQGRRRRGRIVDRVYLVESHGDLLMVLKTYDNVFAPPGDGEEERKHHPKLDFEVYKLDLSGDRPRRWVELESLGRRSLFLGPGQAISLCVGDVPGGSCQGNCIYFSDYRPERHKASVHGGPDFGVFHYGDGHVERVPCCPVGPGSIWQPSIWISPTLRGTSCWD